jgi:hypothetical protein
MAKAEDGPSKLTIHIAETVDKIGWLGKSY